MHPCHHNHAQFRYENTLFNQNIGSEPFFKAVEQALPAVFTREVASQAIGGLISPKTMSNEDSLGRGPAGKVRIGSKVGYTREAFIVWLRGKLRSW